MDKKEFLMGNEAIALGALAAGVNLVAGYPGTPSTEVLETVAKYNPGHVYVEWSINEKAAMEVAAGAAYSGARVLVTMKQVGLNVAADPLMSLEYIGIEGGMVILVADDPGPISSQTEQDTRTFAAYSKVPVFDPCSVEDAYAMIQEAFAFSEKYKTPVFFRPTTRIDHGYASLEAANPDDYLKHPVKGFIKDPSRWVIFPRLSVKNHALIEKRNAELSDVLSDYSRNVIRWEKNGDDACRGTVAGNRSDENDTCQGIDTENRPGPALKKGIASQGISYMYALDTPGVDRTRILRVATPFPFPEKLALSFLDGLDEVLCIEELDPVIERALTYVCGKYGLQVKIRGKLTGDIPPSGENSREIVARAVADYVGLKQESPDYPAPPDLPVRPPVLCAGCPHRASFYAVKMAMKGQKTIYCGDIGCYTLGNAAPLDMCDTCLCMGAGLGIAQGVGHLDPETRCFAFVGDSTFFASGITGTINAFYNQADMTLVVLDNSTTAMTGHQPHPGTGRTVMGQIVDKVSIEKILRAIGLTSVEVLDPLDHEKCVKEVGRIAALPGVKAIIFRSPCIAITRPAGRSEVDADRCIGCRKCINQLGCPALVLSEDRDSKGHNKVIIDSSQCTGCTLCEQICPAGAISGGRKNDRGGDNL